MAYPLSMNYLSSSYAMYPSYVKFTKSPKVSILALWLSKAKDLALILFVKLREECRESAEVIDA